jgi:Xaa-Pro aminopeptidase
MMITDTEFDVRIAQVRCELMRPRNIDLLLLYADDVFQPGNVRYLTNFDLYANYAMVMLPSVGELSLTYGLHHSAYLVRVKEVARAGYLRGTKTPAGHCRELIDEMGISHPRIGLVGTREMFQCMRVEWDRLFPDASFQDVTADFEGIRWKKSSAEIACLRRSAIIAGRGLLALKAHLRTGISELKLIAEAGMAARHAGADVLTREMIGFRVASGEAVLRSPGPPTDRILREGEPFAVEISPQFEGYRTVLGRTFVVGDSTPEESERSIRIRSIHRRICGSIKPGLRACEIALQAKGLFEKAGLLDYMGESVGHGIGLDPEESPGLDLNDQTVLVPGMALVVRSAAVRPGTGGVFWADTVVVGRDEPTLLSRE